MIGDTKKIYGPHEWANKTERGKNQKGRWNKHKDKEKKRVKAKKDRRK